MGKRIVLATFGSLGDLHPFLAVALGLKERGSIPVIATHEFYRRRIEALGLGFAPLRPDYDPSRAELNFLSMDPWRGSEHIVRKGLFPALRDTYEDLERAVAGADLLVSHAIVFAGPLLAEKTKIPWVSVTLSPMTYMSIHDPPHAAPVPWVNGMWTLGPGMNRMLMGLIRRRTDKWCGPVQQLRRDLGLTVGQQPFFEGLHSSSLGLALFSNAMGAPQVDWPQSTRQTGFCFLDDARQMPVDMQRFLDEGPPPVVFTLGSAAVLTAGEFFIESERAVRELGCRAVFIVGKESRIKPSKDVFVAEYAPYSQVFARASVVVHQGGIGTTAQCLRAGCPALVVPFAHDQPDNAARVIRLGTGRSIPRSKYNAARAVRELRTLMDESFSARAIEVAKQLAKEDGVDAACRALLEQI
jgi:UDP:flavonoid glycosyltransferase YjiC (YdhE family)